MFLPLICNSSSSSLSSFSDHLPKNNLKYMIAERAGCRVQNLCIPPQECCVGHVPFPTVRRAVP